MPGDAAKPARDLFASTHWSVVLAAGSADTGRSGPALEHLCRSYWQPLYVYLRHKGHPPEDAEDLTQEFFARLLESRALEGLAPSRGRFRAFLLACLKHFLANVHDRAQTLRRGGGQQTLSLDFANLETHLVLATADGETPDRAFDRQWASLVLETVLRRLRTEFESQGKTAFFEALKPALTGDRLDEPYAAVAERFGLRENALKVAVHRLRRRYRELLRAEIAETVASPEEVDQEMRELFLALS